MVAAGEAEDAAIKLARSSLKSIEPTLLRENASGKLCWVEWWCWLGRKRSKGLETGGGEGGLLPLAPIAVIRENDRSSNARQQQDQTPNDRTKCLSACLPLE